MCVTRFHDSNCMPTRSNNFALETTRKREEDDDVADVGWKAGEKGGRGGTRRYIKKFLRHEWTSDLRVRRKVAKGSALP